MVDAYPAKESDPSYAIHQKIDDTLRNCRSAAAPHATLGQLYPEIFLLSDRSPWLTPALERLDWNLRRDPPGEAWAAHLSPLINLILHEMRQGTAAQLHLLCEHAAYLAAHNCHYVAQRIATFAWNLHCKAGLSPTEVQQLRKVYAAFGRTEATALYRIGWTLFRSPSGPDPRDLWCAAIHRDLQAMPTDGRRAWHALLDANDHGFHFSGTLPKSTLKRLARIAPAEFAAGFAAWTGLLKDTPPQLSYTGLTLLNWLLRLCAAAPALSVDESLYRIAAARWTPSPNPRFPELLSTGWLSAYLMVLPTRSQTSAFACVEALAMNPATQGFSDVTQLYQSLLSTAVTAAAPPANPVTGIDGFPIDPGHPLAAEQLLLEQFLRAAHPGEARARQSVAKLDGLQPVRASLVRQASTGDPDAVPRMIAALADRVTWLHAHARDFTEDACLFWCVETGKLMYELLPHLKDPKPDVLRAAFQSDSLGFYGYSPGDRIFEICRTYVDQHGWSADLIAALETWIKTLHGTIAAQTLRRRAGWFLLFEELSPIKVSDCWGNLVRADLRKIPEPERKRWRAVLENASFTNADKPPAKWLKPARPAFQQLGAENFQARFRAWFEPFRAGEPLKLTVPGRDLLRILMWYALIAENPQVDEALAWYGEATWKNTASAGRAATTATAFAYVLPERNPRRAYEVFKQMLATGAAPAGGKIDQAYQALRV